MNQGKNHSPIMKYRRKWCIFFVIQNMCIEKKMEPFNSGELQKILRNISCIAFIGLIASGKHDWQKEETRTYFSILQVLQEQSCISGYSGRNLIDPSLQDNVIIQSNFFKFPCHVGCAVNLHSMISSGLIPGGESLSNRQTVFFLDSGSYGEKSQGS